MSNTYKYHRFLDEAGDTAFFSRNKLPAILGNGGASKSFAIGMLTFNQPIDEIRAEIVSLQNQIAIHPLYKDVPSVVKRVNKGGFYFHAKDDMPDLRKDFFDFIRKTDCNIDIIVARKEVTRFVNKHNGKEAEFYADILSHLMKEQMLTNRRILLNIAKRDSSTKTNNLNLALEKARLRIEHSNQKATTDVLFNVVPFTQEPLLAIADYLCWAVQRVFELGETRYYDYLIEKIGSVVDLYDTKNEENVYTIKNPLTPKNEISP